MTDGPLLLPTLRQVSRDTLQDQVYRQIREALMSGRFQPGQKLTIRGLAEALGSSPMPVRAVDTMTASLMLRASSR